MSAGVKVASATPPLPRKVDYFSRSLRARSSSHNALAASDAVPRHTSEAPRYVFDEETDAIGSGAYGNVFRAVDVSDGSTVAVKRTKHEDREEHRDPRGSTHASREVAAMMHLKHKHIVRMVDTYMDASLHIVYEFAEHGDLFDWATGKYARAGRDHRPVVSSRTLTRLARQTGSALAYCHKCRVAQRDFKLENIIVVREEPNIKVKIVDFGLSYGVYYAESDTPKTCEKAGSMDYAAPEVLVGNDLLDPYKADVWSYGIVMFILAHHSFPWVAEKDRRRPDKFPASFAHEIEPHVRDGFRGILEQALQFCPDDRPSMEYLAADERISSDEANDTFSVLQMVEFSSSDDGESVPGTSSESGLTGGTPPPSPPPLLPGERDDSRDSVIVHHEIYTSIE